MMKLNKYPKRSKMNLQKFLKLRLNQFLIEVTVNEFTNQQTTFQGIIVIEIESLWDELEEDKIMSTQVTEKIGEQSDTMQSFERKLKWVLSIFSKIDQ